MTKNDKQLFMKVHIPGFYQKWIANRKAYLITCPGSSQILTPSHPKLPFLSYIVALPNDTPPIIRVSYTSTMLFPKKRVILNPQNLTDSKSIQRKANYKNIKHKHYQWPVRVRFEKLGKLHKLTFAKISIMPFFYDISQNHLHVGDQFTVEITLKKGIWPTRVKRKTLRMLDKSIYNLRDEEIEDIEEEIPEEYLIITHNKFVQTLAPFVKWREAEGFLVTIKTLNEIKKQLQITEFLSASKLREYLSLYYNKQPNLTYILLAGDVEYIPVKYKNGDGTDLYYSLLDGTGDLLPDVYLGRFPVDTCHELSSIIEKIIQYEKNVPSKKILLASYFQDSGLDGVSDRDYIYTSEQFRNFLVSRQYRCKRVYTKTPNSNPAYYSNRTPVARDITFNGTTSDIINFINTGAAIVNHRDHGDENGWVDPPLKTEDLSGLWNKRYPIMFNVDCATGKFDIETANEERETEGGKSQKQESFSEQILRLRKRGVVSIIAPTRITVKSLNNNFNRGLMEAIWPKMFHANYSPATRLGQVLYRARIRILRESGGNGWISEKIQGNFRRYHILGDPALRIKQPQ